MRALARTQHPDKAKHMEKGVAELRWKAVQVAGETLTTPERRRDFLHTGVRAGNLVRSEGLCKVVLWA